MSSGPIIGNDGTIFVTDVLAGTVQSVSPNGDLFWTANLGGRSSLAAKMADGTILVATSAVVQFVGSDPVVLAPARLWALNLANGVPLWNSILSSHPDARGDSQVVVANNAVYALLRPVISSARCNGLTPCETIPVLFSVSNAGVLNWSVQSVGAIGIAKGSGNRIYAVLDDAILIPGGTDGLFRLYTFGN